MGVDSHLPSPPSESRHARTHTRILAVFALVPAARADDVKDAEAKLKDYLAGIKGSEAGRVTTLTADGVKETFPDHVLFSHVIPLFPVAPEAPSPAQARERDRHTQEEGR